MKELGPRKLLKNMDYDGLGLLIKMKIKSII